MKHVIYAAVHITLSGLENSCLTDMQQVLF